jgi:hypothetical protein
MSTPNTSSFLPIDLSYASAHDVTRRREDPVQELAKIRKSLSSIEQYIHRNGGLAVSSPDFESSTSLEMFSFPTLANNDIKPAPTPPLTASAGPGSLGRRSGGLYNGPTSDSTHLIGVSNVSRPFLSDTDGVTERGVRFGRIH